MLGVIGGMGPMATARFYGLVVGETAADCDQEHIHVVVDGNAMIPDRTWAIEHGRLDDLLAALKVSVGRLVGAGADVLAMPCNTAHVVYAKLAQACPVPLLNMVDETRAALLEAGCLRPVLLATKGTISTGLYQRALDGLNPVPPDDGQVETVHSAIAHIKGGQVDEARKVLLEVIPEMVGKGGDGIVLACTDIPLALDGCDLGVPVFDTARILARAAVRECRNT